MSRRRFSAPAVAIIAVLALAVGCSSSDSSDAKGSDAKSSSSSTTTESGSGDTSDTTDTTVSGGGEDGTETTAAGGGDIELTGDFCEKAAKLDTLGDALFGDMTSGTSPEELLAGIKDLFRTIDSVYGQLNEDPPAAIADEIGMLAEFASTNYEKVKDMTSYEEAAKVAQSALGQGAGTDEFDAASTAIGEYVEKECGISAE